MVLGFKPQLKPLVLDGTKIHTIREDPHKRWRPGRKIHFATGVRTKNYHQFHEGFCVNVEPILIVNHGSNRFVMIGDEDKKYIHSDCLVYGEKDVNDVELLSRVACNDGLSMSDFINWFVPNYRDKFRGSIIHWTNFSYT